MAPVLLAELSAIFFVATVFRTAFGFGEALVAVPLLSLLIPIHQSAPVAVLASILIAFTAVVRDWRHIHFSSAGKLIASTLLGLPFGLLLLRYVPEAAVKALLGLLLLAFSSFSLLRPTLIELRNDRFAWLFGFLAGVTGGSYGMNGPPLAIYGAARRWEPHRFRATMQAYFLPASLCGMAGYYFAGLWTREVSVLFGYALPAIAIGIVCGFLINRRVDGRRFTRVLHVALLFIAGTLLWQSLSLSLASHR